MQTVSLPMEQLAQLLAVQLENGLAPLRVTGSSMHPVLRDRRDTVYLQAAQRPLKKGDVILYCRDNGTYVLHRIVRVMREGKYICSGDNQYTPESVEAGQVLAVMESFCRGDRVYSAEHPGYRAFVWVWVGLFPVRRPLLALRRRLGRLRKRKRSKSLYFGGIKYE